MGTKMLVRTRENIEVDNMVDEDIIILLSEDNEDVYIVLSGIVGYVNISDIATVLDDMNIRGEQILAAFEHSHFCMKGLCSALISRCGLMVDYINRNANKNLAVTCGTIVGRG